MVKCPHARDDESGTSQLIALFAEATIFLGLAYKTFDLANAGEIVVQERIHSRSGAAVQPVSPVRSKRIPKRATGEERHWREREQGQFCAEVKHSRYYHHDLQYRHRAFLDAVDQDTLDRAHVLQNPRHQIASGAIIEPAQRQSLNV